MYIDKSEWQEAGAESGICFSEVMKLEGPDVPKSWSITGQLLGTITSDNILLAWSFENLSQLDGYDITLVAGENEYDMRESTTLSIDSDHFLNMQITIGPLISDDDCEEGLVACPDGSCVASLDDCSCESQGLVECNDGSCALSADDCSCESECW